jgi:hypothetical protein
MDLGSLTLPLPTKFIYNTLQQMKKYIFFLLMCATLSTLGQSKVKVDQNGNYVSTSIPRTKGVDTATGKYFIDSKGVKYPVMLTSTGRLVYYKTAKSGNVYKVYIDK